MLGVGASLAGLALSGCYIRTLDDETLGCPCADGYTCSNDRCIPGRRDAATAPVDTGLVVIDAFLPPDGPATSGEDVGVVDDTGMEIDTGVGSEVDVGVPIDTGMPIDAPGGSVLTSYVVVRCSNAEIRPTTTSTAARIDVPGPVRISSVEYTLVGSGVNPACTHSRNHSWFVWSQPVGAPATNGSTQANYRTGSVTEPAGASDYVGHVTLSPSLDVPAGHSLIVVLAPQSGDQMLCQQGCQLASPNAGAGYLSFGQIAEPWSWQDFTTISGVDHANLSVRAQTE